MNRQEGKKKRKKPGEEARSHGEMKGKKRVKGGKKRVGRGKQKKDIWE